MLVSGPIGAMATGSGLAAISRAISATAPSGSAGLGDGVQDGGPDAALAVHLGRPHDGAEQRPGGSLGHRDVVPAVGVQEAQGVLGAAGDVRVAADRGHREQPDLRAGRREADGQGVVEARVAVDDQRDRMLAPSRQGAVRTPAPALW